MNGQPNQPRFRFQAPLPLRTPFGEIPTAIPQTGEEAVVAATKVGKAIQQLGTIYNTLHGEDRDILSQDINDLVRYRNQLLAYADELTGPPSWVTTISTSVWMQLC